MKKHLSIREAAVECGINRIELYSRLQEFEGVFDVSRPGAKRRTWRIPVVSVERWRRNRQKVQR